MDPYITEYEDYSFTDDVYKSLEDADAMVLMTAHDEFLDLDFRMIKRNMNIPLIIDGRRIYDPDKLREMGFKYRGVGARNSI